MKTKKISFLLILPLLLFGCASKMKVTGNIENKLQPLKNHESVVIIEENESIKNLESNIKIGVFEIKDGGLSFDCSYERVKSLAKNRARSIGGNSVKILEHKLPDSWSTCHRIKFEVYKLEDIVDYQKEIIWSSTDKLKWEFFKGAPKIDRSSQFCGYIDVQFNDVNFLNGKGEVNVTPLFLFECAYVQPLKKDKNLLEYNQVKFDLLEVYSRKMRNEFIKSEINTQDKWLKFAESIYKKVYTEYETDMYNLETETNFGEYYSGLLSWKYKVENDLKELTEFSTEKS